MKKIILFALLLSATVWASAQEPVFVKGDRAVNLGVGLTRFGMVSVSAEQGIYDGILETGCIGAGIYAGAGYSFWSADFNFVGGLRGTFHYPIIEKFDTYVGVDVGIQYNLDLNSADNLWPDGGGFLGARYAYSEKFSLFLEVGYSSIGYLVGGLAFRL